MKKLLILFVLLFCLTSESCKENTSVTAHGTEKGYLVVKKDKLENIQISYRETTKSISYSKFLNDIKFNDQETIKEFSEFGFVLWTWSVHNYSICSSVDSLCHHF